jgi:hypothetical protein
VRGQLDSEVVAGIGDELFADGADGIDDSAERGGAGTVQGHAGSSFPPFTSFPFQSN